MPRIGNGIFGVGDCFELMARLPDASVDMILADLPYGTTACAWDSVLSFERLWPEYWRIAKPRAAIVLTASQPFTSALVMSQPKTFRYLWVWVKNRATGFANAKKQPLRKAEDCCVFYRETSLYNPQGLIYSPKIMRNSKSTGGVTVQGENIGSQKGNMRSPGKEYIQEFTNYPTQILELNSDPKSFHPTQKPVALFEYLIRTYTNEGDTVLDNTAGSGTTAVAAENAGRKWICIERDEEYAAKAMERIRAHVASSVSG